MSYSFSYAIDLTEGPEIWEEVSKELEEVSKSFQLQDFVRLKQTHVAPAKPRDGYIYYADGTNWNPGSGEGIYAYYNASWNKL